MGTRGITKVIRQEKNVIAQYGQWDHYPSGQGITALEFLRRMNLDEFMSQLDKCRWGNSEDETERTEYLKSIGSENGWMTMEQSDLYNKKYPLDTRDNGANILNMIYDDKKASEFILNECTDGSWIEGVYTIDLDNRIFRVEYHDVDKTFSLDNLPTNEKFLSVCEPNEDDE